jgi:replicative DNA helicase
MTYAPLCDLTAEQALLGAMLLTPTSRDRALESLTPHDFYQPRHQNIFAAIAELEASSIDIDVVTVASRLSRSGFEIGAGDLMSMAAATPSTAIDGYIAIIKERATARRVTTAAHDAIAGLHDGSIDAPTALHTLGESIYAAELGTEPNRCIGIETVADHYTDAVFEELTSADPIVGYRSGFIDLDRLLGGLRPGTLTIVGGRPGMGKSVFGLAVATHQARVEKNPTLLVSLEMAHRELWARLLASHAEVDISRRPLQQPQMAKLANAEAELRNIALTIDTTATLGLTELRARAKRIKRQHNGALGVIVIDYLQLMNTPSGETRQVEVATLTRGLKALALDLDCAVVALAQLSRNLEQRQDKRPMLSDLRESGAIEQDADNVLFLYRDEVYDPNTTRPGIADVLIRKARNGPIGSIELAWLQHLPALKNRARHHTPPQPAG